MELLNLYLESLPKKRSFHSEGRYSVWDEFINSDAHQISIVAGRQTGKTTAILRRAIMRKDKTVYIGVATGVSLDLHQQMIECLADEMDMDWSCYKRSRFDIRYQINDHEIRLTKIYWIRNHIQGIRNCEIIMEDPEYELDNINTDYEFLEDLLRYNSVALVGTYKNYQLSAAKIFHERASCRHDAYTKKITTLGEIIGRDVIAMLECDYDDYFFKKYGCVRV